MLQLDVSYYVCVLKFVENAISSLWKTFWKQFLEYSFIVFWYDHWLVYSGYCHAVIYKKHVLNSLNDSMGNLFFDMSTPESCTEYAYKWRLHR